MMDVSVMGLANLYRRRYENGETTLIFMDEENKGCAHFGIFEFVDSRVKNGKGNAESIEKTGFVH